MTTRDISKPAAREQTARPAPSNRPEIKYAEAQLPEIVDRAAQALVDADAGIYARGTALARVVRLDRADVTDGIARAEGAVTIVPVDKPALVEELTRSIGWLRYDKRVEDWKNVAAPALVAETMIARRGDWPFRQLRSVVSAPTLRPDGSVLNRSGFDPATGLFLATDDEWPRIPTRPSRDQAMTALAKLKALIATFPFEAPPDLSAALAMLLTALVRPSLSAAPMFTITATAPGSGKSKLGDIAAVLATGRPAAVMAAPDDEAELEKRLGASLMAGDLVVTIDNVERPLRSQTLCQLLTQPTLRMRVLGQSVNLDLPTSALMIANGNAMRVAGDLTRRVVRIGLDAKVERPELRTFKGPEPVALACSRRRELVAAGLTVLRGWLASEEKATGAPFGSFETWSQWIRGALLWLGEVDPLAGQDRIRADDPEREQTLEILAALPGGDWAVRDIAVAVDSALRSDHFATDDDRRLADALAPMVERGSLSRGRFSGWLMKNNGRIVGGRRIERGEKDRTNAVRWRVAGA